jgi:hypothetical protein
VKSGRQRTVHCVCGNVEVLAPGLCATCYTLKRQDEEFFGGLRGAVLERDGYRCRVYDASGRDKRSITSDARYCSTSSEKSLSFLDTNAPLSSPWL